MHRVAVLALPDVIPFELGIPSRIFDSATGSGNEQLYDVAVCTLDGRAVRTEAGRIVVDQGPELLAVADTVVIPPFHPRP